LGAQLCNRRTLKSTRSILCCIINEEKKIEEQKQNLLPDFEKVIPNPLITPMPIPARQPPKYQIQTEPDIDGYEDDSQRIVDDVQKGLEE
jgi:hypothetical protein